MSESNRTNETVSLPRTHLAALQDCARYAPHRGYIWKPKTMEKLHALGLVQKTGQVAYGRVCYEPSAKGRELLTALQEVGK